MNTAVKSAKATKTGVTLILADAKSHEETEMKCDIALVSVGRRPNTEGLGLEELGVVITERCQIIVDENFETNISGIFAFGDICSYPG